MSTINSFDKNLHFLELASPLFTGNPVPLTPAQRRRLAQINLGLTSLSQFATGLVPTSQNATGTMTAAQLLAGIITTTSAAAVVATLPLGTSLETAMATAFGTLAVNDSFEFMVVNTGPNILTVTTNTGWTLVGRMIVDIPSGTATGSGTFRVVRTAASTFTLYRLS